MTEKESKLKVIIAEDYSGTRELYKNILKGEKFELKLVGNGKELYKEVSQNKDKYNVIISDTEMPNGYGNEVCSRLIKEGYKRIIVGVSGITTNKDLWKGIANAFMDKAFTYRFLHDLDLDNLEERVKDMKNKEEK